MCCMDFQLNTALGLVTLWKQHTKLNSEEHDERCAAYCKHQYITPPRPNAYVPLVYRPSSSEVTTRNMHLDYTLPRMLPFARTYKQQSVLVAMLNKNSQRTKQALFTACSSFLILQKHQVLTDVFRSAPIQNWAVEMHLQVFMAGWANDVLEKIDASRVHKDEP